MMHRQGRLVVAEDRLRYGDRQRCVGRQRSRDETEVCWQTEKQRQDRGI